MLIWLVVFKMITGLKWELNDTGIIVIFNQVYCFSLFDTNFIYSPLSLNLQYLFPILTVCLWPYFLFPWESWSHKREHLQAPTATSIHLSAFLSTGAAAPSWGHLLHLHSRLHPDLPVKFMALQFFYSLLICRFIFFYTGSFLSVYKHASIPPI